MKDQFNVAQGRWRPQTWRLVENEEVLMLGYD